eukprot:2884538-Rhodomonas_salina.1
MRHARQRSRRCHNWAVCGLCVTVRGSGRHTCAKLPPFRQYDRCRFFQPPFLPFLPLPLPFRFVAPMLASLAVRHSLFPHVLAPPPPAPRGWSGISMSPSGLSFSLFSATDGTPSLLCVCSVTGLCTWTASPSAFAYPFACSPSAGTAVRGLNKPPDREPGSPAKAALNLPDWKPRRTAEAPEESTTGIGCCLGASPPAAAPAPRLCFILSNHAIPRPVSCGDRMAFANFKFGGP